MNGKFDEEIIIITFFTRDKRRGLHPKYLILIIGICCSEMFSIKKGNLPNQSILVAR